MFSNVHFGLQASESTKNGLHMDPFDKWIYNYDVCFRWLLHCTAVIR